MQERDIVNNAIEKSTEAATIAGELLIPVTSALLETTKIAATYQLHRTIKKKGLSKAT